MLETRSLLLLALLGSIFSCSSSASAPPSTEAGAGGMAAGGGSPSVAGGGSSGELSSAGRGGAKGVAGAAQAGAPSAGAAGAVNAGGAGGSGPTQTLSYTVDDATVFPNPERGFYHHRETNAASYSALTASELTAMRTQESITLVLRVVYLQPFLTSAISQDTLTKLGADFAAARAAGVKLVLRFAYTASETGNDATKDRILAHVDQLAPLFVANVDVIATVQAGLIGAWGEWYYTQNFGNTGTVSAQDYENRKAVVDRLLQAVPATRTVQLRTPNFKRMLYGNAALTTATAFGSTPAARLGHHNDAFVADATDMGTYLDLAVEGPYLAADSAFLPVGGETNQYAPPRTACPSALAEMTKFHWSYINTDYFGDTITQWKQQGCYATMQQQLGYRLVLTKATLSKSAPVAGSVTVELGIVNKGFAAPFNPRALELVLRAKSGGQTHRLALTSDPRRLLPGGEIRLTETLKLTGIPSGEYDLLLALPDPTAALHDRPDFAIRLANEGTWDATLGANRLNATLVIAD